MEYPIPKHYTWDILDSTKLQTFVDCPRRYFFNYMLGWDGESDNVHLIFGGAWHRAMEHLLLNGYAPKSVLDAYSKLNSYYRKYFSEENDDIRAPKTPAIAMKALAEYCTYWRMDDFKVLYTEIAGTVPIGDKRVLYFRMDSIIEHRDKSIGSLEHKTASRNDRVWADQWLLAIQTGTYNHVLYCLFPRELVEKAGVTINGSIFNKTKMQFVRVPARRSRKMMNAWFWNVRHWVAMLDWEMERLKECKDSDDVLMSFPMNTQSCTKYFGCPYMIYCSTWPNPLQNCEYPPFGMVQRWWDPTADEENTKGPVKHRFDLAPVPPEDPPPPAFMRLEWQSDYHARLV